MIPCLAIMIMIMSTVIEKNVDTMLNNKVITAIGTICSVIAIALIGYVGKWDSQSILFIETIAIEVKIVILIVCAFQCDEYAFFISIFFIIFFGAPVFMWGDRLYHEGEIIGESRELEAEELISEVDGVYVTGEISAKGVGYYRYYVQTEDGYKIETIHSESVSIVITDGDAKIVHETVYLTKKNEHFGGITVNTTNKDVKTIYVPEGGIR